MYRSVAAIFTIAILLTGVATADTAQRLPDGPSTTGTGSSTIVEIRLSTDLKQYGPTDSIMLSAVVTNIGPQQILWDHWTPINWIVDLNVSRLTSSSPEPTAGRSGYREPNTSASILNSGQSKSFKAPLSAWGFTVNQPGVYQIAGAVQPSIFHTIGGGPVEVHMSAPLVVTIK